MSLAARCPWCETVFRLTEGQVSAKGGMARCGVCNHTFNALDALLSDSAVAALERGAQAREANQEATARANEQNAIKAADSIPIPISIRKIFGGADATPPAPATSSPPTSPISAPLSAPSSPSSLPAAAPPAAAPPAPAPPAPAPSAPSPWVAMPLRDAAMPAPAPEKPTTATEVELPEAGIEPVREPASFAPRAPFAAPTTPSAEFPLAAQPAARAAMQPAAQSPAPVEPPAAPAAPNGTVEPAASEEHQPAPPQAIPIDYKVEMPNYDAERAAALAEAERLQNEEREQHQQRESGEPHSASTAVEQEIDALQSALSPTAAAEEDEAGQADETQSAPTSATLNALRLQHAAVQAANNSDLVREDERLGPNTFQPSFLLTTQSPARFRRTRRFFGSLLALVLLVLLVAQATYWWRSDVAIRVPQTRPYLVRACQRLNCEVGPTAQIDQLSIESSELVAAPGGGGALGFTALVRNHSVNALAYPAIEITLTDARDQAILRRVFLPDNYLGDALVNKRLAGIPGNSEYTLKLTFNTSGVATSGYRAGIFYP